MVGADDRSVLREVVNDSPPQEHLIERRGSGNAALRILEMRSWIRRRYWSIAVSQSDGIAPVCGKGRPRAFREKRAELGLRDWGIRNSEYRKVWCGNKSGEKAATADWPAQTLRR